MDVFISYRRAQRSRVEPIKNKLESLGLSVFFDIHGIDGGADFPSVIDANLRTAKAILACWSPLYFQRKQHPDWCMVECGFGLRQQKLVPIAVEQFSSDAPPVEMHTLNYFDLTAWRGQDEHEDWQRTLSTLSRLLGRKLVPPEPVRSDRSAINPLRLPEKTDIAAKGKTENPDRLDISCAARICIDFGDELSTACICLDPTLPLEVGLKALPIGEIAGAEHPLVTPCAMYVDGGRVYFGPSALERAHRGVGNARDPLLSFKAVLGTSNVQEALQVKLRPSMDPTATFKQRDALVLYLAYLDQLIREAIGLGPNMPSGVANSKRRCTTTRKSTENINSLLRGIFNEGAAVSRILGRKLLSPDGILLSQGRDALEAASAAPGDGRFETSVERLQAAAATALAFSDTPMRFVVVIDMNASTTDIAAFEFDDRIDPPKLTEIADARQFSALAGDEIDRIVIELMLRRAGIDRNNPDDMRTLRAAHLTARELKKDLFKHGKCIMRIGRKTITVHAKEIAEDPTFRTYQQALAQTFGASLRVVAPRAQAASVTRIDVVLTGNCSNLPFIPSLVQQAGNSVTQGVQLHVGPLSAINPLYSTDLVSSLGEVFPQIVTAIGGSLVEFTDGLY